MSKRSYLITQFQRYMLSDLEVKPQHPNFALPGASLSDTTFLPRRAPSSPLTMPSPLPPELIDYTISFVRDSQTLCNCALTSRTWLSASRHNLFRHIWISRREQFESFVRCVLHVPHMRPYLRFVQQLYIFDRHSYFAHLVPHHFVGHMSQLRHLKFVGVPWRLGLTTFMTISGFVSVRILELAHCRFHNFTQFHQLVFALPQLLELRLFDVTWQHGWPGHLGGRAFRRPRLETLAYFGDNAGAKVIEFETFARWLVTTPSVQSIINLSLDHHRITLEMEEFSALDTLLRILQSLAYLTVPIYRRNDELVTLAHSRNLRSLSITGCKVGDGEILWVTLATMLSEVASRLQRLLISGHRNFHLPGTVFGTLEKCTIDCRGVDALDQALDRESFADLKEVVLDFALVDVHHQLLPEGICEDVRNALPHLHSRGILVVNISWNIIGCQEHSYRAA